MTETPGDGTERARRDIPTDSFANRLMLARAHAGHLSIRDAAERCGLGRGAWTHWEKGGVPVDLLYVVEVISEKLGVDPAWLLEGGALAEPETRSRRMRWSTVRPMHGKQIAGDGSQTTVSKLLMAGAPADVPDRPMPDRPRDTRPSGRPTRSAPAPTTRRPVRLG